MMMMLFVWLFPSLLYFKNVPTLMCIPLFSPFLSSSSFSSSLLPSLHSLILLFSTTPLLLLLLPDFASVVDCNEHLVLVNPPFLLNEPLLFFLIRFFSIFVHRLRHFFFRTLPLFSPFLSFFFPFLTFSPLFYISSRGTFFSLVHRLSTSSSSSNLLLG